MASEYIREFRCSMCGDKFAALTLELLSAVVNQHNMDEHKDVYCAWWAPSTITYSNFYSGPGKASTEEQIQAKHPDMKPEYAKRWGTAENSAHPPALTQKDRELLDALHVKWED